MEKKQVSFSKMGGSASVDIIIGEAHQGTYRVYLWDSNGQNPKMIGAGTNWDSIADTIELGAVKGLNNKIVTWEIMISVAKVQPGQFYYVNAIFRQDGKIVDQVSETGPIQGSKSVVGAAQIIVA